MYISLDWLKDFVNIPKNISPEELGMLLTMHTVEIDSVQKQSDKFKDIVVGKILEISEHPNADRLSLVKVDIGKNTSAGSVQGKLSIVCGAPNLEVGQFVPVALAGATLPNGTEIKEAEVRGEKSTGMLCAEDELELGDDHTGILILDKKAKAGQNLGNYFNIKDTVFEVDNKSITHRPDLWSHLGIAREIAAFLGVKFKGSDAKLRIECETTKPRKFSVRVKDFKLCPRYMAVAIDGIKIEASPKWIQERLLVVGMRPINNIVDITNYVMLELGQPLHAFDSKLVDKIIVRRAKSKEAMDTLDGQARELDKEMLVVADSKKPIAIAGVMGGANSEIADNTSSIIIEAGNWEPTQIRKTAQKLGIRTESSMRFEKSLDPNLCETGITRAVELVKKLCPKAKVVSRLVDEKKFKLDQGPIKVDLDWLNKIIGAEIAEQRVVGILKNLDFGVEKKDKELSITVPTWRATGDISIPEDLVEEIVRIYGYDNVVQEMPKVVMQAPPANQELLFERKIKNILSSGARLTESYNYSFVNEAQLKKMGVGYKDYIRLANPISSQHTMLRQSLIPNLLENIKLNQARYDDINLFEIGNVYFNTPGDMKKDGAQKEFLPLQEKQIGLALAGTSQSDVYNKIKGVIENLLNYLDLGVSFTTTEIFPSWADIKTTARIEIDNKNIGVVSSLNVSKGQNIGLKKVVVLAEINFKDLYNIVSNLKAKKYKEALPYPKVVRDLAFVVNNRILYNEIKQELEGFNKLIKSVELFDVYQGEKLGPNKKNLAFHIEYQAQDRTLTAEEVDKLQAKLINRLEKKFSAQVRNF